MREIGRPDEEECFAQDIDPVRIRDEVRRVWVVEGAPWEGLESRTANGCNGTMGTPAPRRR
jgi:hypothetical protein